jgi:hypothetical protein
MTEPSKVFFLSYASQDAEAARRIRDTLSATLVRGVHDWLNAARQTRAGAVNGAVAGP